MVRHHRARAVAIARAMSVTPKTQRRIRNCAESAGAAIGSFADVDHLPAWCVESSGLPTMKDFYL